MNTVKIDDLVSIKENRPHLISVYDGYIIDGMYRVLLANTGKYKHMRIRRLDDLPISDFTLFQNLKNHFFGDEVEGIQVFPKKSNYVDNTNTYHIFTWIGIETPDLKKMYEYINEQVPVC
jgi:hypothetical protein